MHTILNTIYANTFMKPEIKIDQLCVCLLKRTFEDASFLGEKYYLWINVFIVWCNL